MRVLTTRHERDGEGTSASLKKKQKTCRDVRENEMLALNHAETPLQRNYKMHLAKHCQGRDFSQTGMLNVVLAFPLCCEAST